VLAAAPSSEERALQLFKVALTVLKRGDQPPSASLLGYVEKVIQQASALAHDPSKPPAGVMPEAIELALEMLRTAEVREAITSAAQHDAVPPEVASEILRRMERTVVSNF
jgi:hypothetical protein